MGSGAAELWWHFRCHFSSAWPSEDTDSDSCSAMKLTGRVQARHCLSADLTPQECGEAKRLADNITYATHSSVEGGQSINEINRPLGYSIVCNI